MRQVASFSLNGGLDLRAGNIADINPGTMTDCQNVHCHKDGGYQVAMGYELFDGSTPAHQIGALGNGFVDYLAAENAKLPLQTSVGSHEGEIRGLFAYNGMIYAFRNRAGGVCDMFSTKLDDDSLFAVTAFSVPRDATVRTVQYAFAGTRKVYGVSTSGKAFEFDGSTFTFITTGATKDVPISVAAYANHLFLAYAGGSLQHSAIGEPLDWTVVKGAGEIVVGDEITNIIEHNSALIITCSNSIHYLTGSSAADWVLKTITKDTGCLQGCVVPIGSDLLLIDERGPYLLSSTSAYSDFAVAAIISNVSAYSSVFAQAKFMLPNKSTWVNRIFTSYQCVSVTTNGKDLIGFGAQDLPNRGAIVTGLVFDDSGLTRTLIGDAAGYIWELDQCPYADTSRIQFMLSTTPFHFGSPAQRKRFNSVVVEALHYGGGAIRVMMNFDYSGGRAMAYMNTSATKVGLVDVDPIDTFPLDVQPGFRRYTSNISGTGFALGLIFSSDGLGLPWEKNQEDKFIGGARFSAVHIQYTQLRQMR
jgi:hypothetical protein